MKKKYIFPSVVVFEQQLTLLQSTSNIHVNQEEEGDQSEAEGRSYRNSSIWYEDNE